MNGLRVVLCDDDEMVLEALALAVGALGAVVVATTTRAEEALGLVRVYQPDVCVLDAHFRAEEDALPPLTSGPAVAARIREDAPGTAVVMLTADADTEVWAAYDGGLLNGVLNKTLDCATLGSALRAVRCGERVVLGWQRPARPRVVRPLEALTEREREVLRAMVDGAATQEIAHDLAISNHTVRTHVQNVMRKLEVSTRAKATHVAVTQGLLEVG